MGRVVGSNFRVFRGYHGRTFRVVDRSADVELCGEFRVDYFRVCLGGTGGTRFFLFLGKGRAEIEYAGHVGGFVGNRDDFGISLVHGCIVAGYGGDSEWCGDKYACFGCGSTDVETIE